MRCATPRAVPRSTARARRTPTVLTAHGPVTGELGECYRLLSRHHPMVAISEAQRAKGPHLPWAGTVYNAIPVDATLATSVEGVWAIGDVARHDHPVFGPIRVEHFDNAQKMGEHVAKNLLGTPAVFDDAHWFWSDQYDAEIQMAGFATEWDDMVVRGSIENRSFSAFLLKEGQLLSTFSMNRKFDVRRSMALIVAKTPADREQLADPEFDLRQLHPPQEQAT